MSFKSEEWEKDDVGDELHENLFKKNIRNTRSKKQKMPPSETILKKPKADIFKPGAKSILSDSIAKNLKKIIGANPDKSETIKPVDANVGNKKRKGVKAGKGGKGQKTKRVGKGVTKAKVVPKIKKKVKRLEKVESEEDEEDEDVDDVEEAEQVESNDGNNDSNNDSSKIKPVGKILGGLNIANLKKQLAASLEVGRVAELNSMSLREQMMDKLNSARFRFLNEQLYTNDSKEAKKIFQEDPDAFRAYHQGYRSQVEKWPLNPLDLIISSIKKMSSDLAVVDFGCGDAKLADSVPHTVHSFDLVAANDKVTACDMAHVPLKNASVDIAVFCLSLMGTNLKDYLIEANRVLKTGGTLKIAEVESRFEELGIDEFVQILQKFGFKNTMKDLSHNLFYFLDFHKERDVKQKNKLPTLSLKPCLYKKR